MTRRMNDLNRWLVSTTGFIRHDLVDLNDLRAAVLHVRPEDGRLWDRGVRDARAGLRYAVSENISEWYARHPTCKYGKRHAQKIVQAYRKIRTHTA